MATACWKHWKKLRTSCIVVGALSKMRLAESQIWRPNCPCRKGRSFFARGKELGIVGCGWIWENLWLGRWLPWDTNMSSHHPHPACLVPHKHHKHHQAKPSDRHMGEGKGQEVGARHCQSTTLTNRWQTKILKKTKKQTSLDPQPFKLSSDHHAMSVAMAMRVGSTVKHFQDRCFVELANSHGKHQWAV